MNNNDLMQLLEFSPQDLEANRSGQISEAQNFRLRLRRQRAILTGVGIIFVMVFIATICIFVGQRNGSLILALVGISVTIVSAGLTGIFARFWMRISADIRENKTITISGKVERVAKIQFRTVIYLLRVNQAELMVSKETFNAFQQGAAYHFYRAPYSGALLSAEKA